MLQTDKRQILNKTPYEQPKMVSHEKTAAKRHRHVKLAQFRACLEEIIKTYSAIALLLSM